MLTRSFAALGLQMQVNAQLQTAHPPSCTSPGPGVQPGPCL